MFQFKQLYLRPLAAGSLFFSFHFLNAQSTSPPPDSIVLQTVVIQATRAGDESPVPHTNLTAQQIARTYQVQDVPYLLSQIPSLVESSDGGTGVGYTGMRIRGSDPTRLNVTINGIPLNDAESQGVYWVDLPDLAASAAEIQVQRGVGVSTNGAGAFGATVNLDISRIAPEPYGILTNSIGSFGTRKHSIALGTGLLGGKVAFSGRLSQIASAGYVDRASVDLKSYHLSGAYIDADQSLQVHLLSGQEITYQAWNGLPAQYVDIDSLRTYNSAGTERPGDPYDQEVDHYTQRHYLVHYKRIFPKGLQLQLNGHLTDGAGYYEQYKADQSLTDYGLPAPVDTTKPTTDLVRRLWLKNHFYGGTFALRWTPPVNPPALRAAPEFMLGGGVNEYRGQHFGEITWASYGAPDRFRYYDNKAVKLDANVYGKIEMHFRGGWSPLVDLQYRHVRYSFLGFNNQRENVDQTVNLDFFNPKLGLNWAWNNSWKAYAFWGIGHREPNRDDYTQSTPASRPKPEQVQDWEAGVKTAQSNWGIGFNLFYMNYRDQLVLDGRINDVGAYIRTNVDRSYRSGVELEASARIFPWLDFNGNIALSRNIVADFTEYLDDWDTGGQSPVQHHNTDLAFSPALIARGEITWRLLPSGQKQQLSLSLAGKFVGKQYLDNTSNADAVLPAYTYSDLRLNYDLNQIVGQQISLTVALNNIFDAHYASNGWVYRYRSAGYDDRPYNPYTQLEGNHVYHQAGYFLQAGRNIMATLSVKF